MDPLSLHDFHQTLGGRFMELNGTEAIHDYGDVGVEHHALTDKAAVLDLGFRSRLCLAGSDRVRFLHGQVTNDIKSLRAGQGCYAALVMAKGRMQSDLNIYCLADELLLDFEPGLSRPIAERLEKYIIADDVQVVDVSPHYGLLSIQGPQAAVVAGSLALISQLPLKPFNFDKVADPVLGEVYLANQPRLATVGFDFFVPVASLRPVAEKLLGAAQALGGGICGWQALETARIEAGLPRFGVDMDETSLPQECSIEARAVNYNKGCYIGQEVLNRIHTMGHVNRQLCGLKLADDLAALPVKGDKLFHDGKEIGSITSAVHSVRLKRNIALGYVRREFAQPGTELTLRLAQSESPARVAQLPFIPRT